MNSKKNIALTALALAASVSTAFAQTNLWKDNFNDNNPIGWTGWLDEQIRETNQQFVVSGSFGPMQTNNPVGTYVCGIHSRPTSGPLPDQ